MQNLILPIPTGNYGPECVVDEVIASFHATSLASDISSNGAVAYLFSCGHGVGFGGCAGAVMYRLDFSVGSPKGKMLGTTCYDLTLDDAAPTKFAPESTTPLPSSGTWQWPESQVDEWFLSSEFDFRNIGGPVDFELQCLKVVFFTKIVP